MARRCGYGQPRCWSAGAVGEFFGSHHVEGLAFLADPAALGEVGERFVDRLAGGTNELSQLFWGEIEHDAQRVFGAGPWFAFGEHARARAALPGLMADMATAPDSALVIAQ